MGGMEVGRKEDFYEESKEGGRNEGWYGGKIKIKEEIRAQTGRKLKKTYGRHKQRKEWGMKEDKKKKEKRQGRNRVGNANEGGQE